MNLHINSRQQPVVPSKLKPNSLLANLRMHSIARLQKSWGNSIFHFHLLHVRNVAAHHGFAGGKKSAV